MARHDGLAMLASHSTQILQIRQEILKKLLGNAMRIAIFREIHSDNAMKIFAITRRAAHGWDLSHLPTKALGLDLEFEI
jgi:hypothetical protein